MGFMWMWSHQLNLWLQNISSHPVDALWLGVGFLGQALFGMRFLVQWLKSEMEGRSVVPVIFWYLSLGGGLITLTYAVHIGSLPFTLGLCLPLPGYARNIWLIHRERRRAASALQRESV